MALTPYSVSPRRIDHSRGPKPTKNSVTFIRLHLAVAKCPASWPITMMTTATITRKRSPRPVATNTAATAAITRARRTRAAEGRGGGALGGAVLGGAGGGWMLIGPHTGPPRL